MLSLANIYTLYFRLYIATIYLFKYIMNQTLLIYKNSDYHSQIERGLGSESPAHASKLIGDGIQKLY